MLNPQEAKDLIRIARLSILMHLDPANANLYEKEMNTLTKKLSAVNQKKGVFVTLLTYPSLQLRGCIGFPYPVLPLIEAVKEAAREAAFQDPRFMRLAKEELNKIVIEISLLSEPKLMDKATLPDSIEIGKHGLIVQFNGFSGLLLPQVAIEFHFSPLEFLQETCLKAGLNKDTWKEASCKVYCFEAEIWKETSPNGEIEQVKLI